MAEKTTIGDLDGNQKVLEEALARAKDREGSSAGEAIEKESVLLVSIPKEIEQAYLTKVKDKKRGADNLRKWKLEFEKVIFGGGGDILTDEEFKKKMEGFLEEKSPIMKKIINKMTENAEVEKSKSTENEKIPASEADQEEIGAAEVNAELGKYFGKYLYNSKGVCIHISGIEDDKIKFSHRRSDAKGGEEKIKYLTFKNLKSFKDLLKGYSEKKPKKAAEELEAVLKINLYNKNNPKEWIYIKGYDEKSKIAKIFDKRFEDGKKIKEVSFDELEELLKKYTEKTPPTVDDKKKTKAKARVKAEAETKNPEELQGEAMEAFIERNPLEEKATKENILEEGLDAQGENMEAFIKNSSSDKAEEKSEKTPDKDDEVVFEEVVEDGPRKRRSLEDIPVKEDGLHKEEKWPGSIRIKERGSDLEELQAAVEHARMGYAKKDYEVTSVFAKIKKIFGGNLRSIPGNHPETHDQYNAYKIALTELLDYQVAQLKEKNLSPEESGTEMERLTKYYNQDEKANLYAARTDARAEIWEKKYGKAPGWIAKYGGKYINKYRKLNWKTKMALGVGAVLSGAGLLVAGQRILSGAAAGMGVTAVMEARYRQKEEARLAQEQTEIKEKLEKIADPEERYSKFMEHMQAEMDGYGKDLRTEKSKAFQRRMLGATAGIFIGSGALSHLIGWGHTAYDAHFGNPSPELMSSHISSVPHGAAQQEGLPAHDVASSTPEVPPAPPAMPEVHSELGTQNVPEVAKVASDPLGGVETAQEGDSIWKMVARHFEHNTEFSTLTSERQTYVINVLKDRIGSHHDVFNLKDIDKIKIGQEIDFSKVVDNEADFNSIVEHAKHLTPAQLQNIGHNNEAIFHWVESHHGQPLTSPKVEEILSHAQDHPVAVPADSHIAPPAPADGSSHIPDALDHKMPSAEALADNAKDFSAGGTLASAAGLGAVAGRMKVAKEKPVAKDNIVKFPDAAERVEAMTEKKTSENLALLKKEKIEKLAKKYKFNPEADLMASLKDVILKISLKSLENWRVMKDIKFSALGNKDSKISVKLEKNIKELEKDVVNLLGEKAKARPADTLMVWLTRNAKDFLQTEKVEDLQKAA
ncbi:MAG: hypothetical protein WC022_03450 [Parcubacteria group bacterium]